MNGKSQIRCGSCGSPLVQVCTAWRLRRFDYQRVKSELLCVGQMLDPCSSGPWFCTSLHPLNGEQMDIARLQPPEPMLTNLVNLLNQSQGTKSMHCTYIHFPLLEGPQHHPRSRHQVHQVNTSIILKEFTSRQNRLGLSEG